MRYLLVTVFICIHMIGSAFANNEGNTDDGHVVEFVVFVVSDPVEGMKAATALVEDAKAFNDAIISAEIYQSASNPNMLAQRITWKSLLAAKAAFAASENFPNMQRIMKLTTEHVIFDHFYKK